MKLKLLFFITLLLSSSLYAQEEEAVAYELATDYNLWNIHPGDTSFVFVNNAYVRSYPSLDSEILDSIPVGTTVHILSEPYNGTTVKGFYTPWHEISYTKDDQVEKGFIWLGLLALRNNTNEKGERYIYGFDRFVRTGNTEYNPDHYLCTVKLLRADGKVAGSHTFHFDYLNQTYTHSKLLPNMGLAGLEQIYRVEFHGEACGIPTNYYYVGWNGKEFMSMPNRYSVSDAGIYYYDESILFPSEHKQEPNMIYKLIEQGEAIGENEEDYEYAIQKKEEKYSWNGEYFSQILELK